MHSRTVILMRVNALLRRVLFSRAWLARVLFGVKVAAPADVQSYCEWNTALFRLVLPRYLAAGMSVLDIGTGAHAQLAIFAKKHCPASSVLATDVLPERAAFAERAASLSGAAIRVRVSDLFDRIQDEGPFDLILFVPPVIPSDDLAALGYSWQPVPQLGARRCWSSDGGTDGLRVLEPFLEQFTSRLSATGVAMVAMNPAHVSETTVRSLCEQHHLHIVRVHRLPSIVSIYVLAPTDRQLGGKGVAS